MKKSSIPQFGNMQGIKVVTTGTNIAGPVAATFFAEQGAEVVHIESTQAPDMLRRMGKAWSMDHRNGRSMSLNIPSPEGKKIFLKMLSEADILIEASKGGSYDKWGLTDEVLWQANPKLVIAHVSGFGQTGDPKYIGKPSFDPIGQAFSGFVAVNGMPDPAPPYAAKPYTCDYVSALFTAWSVCAALYNAARTGKGESIDLAQYETMVRIQADYLMGGVNGGIQPPRLGAYGNTLQAVPNMLKCADGKYVLTGFGGVGVMRNLELLIGLGDDPDFAEPHPSVQKKDLPRAPKFIAAIEEFVSTHTADEVYRLMDESGVPCSPVMTYDMMLENPQYTARETITQWYDPMSDSQIKGCNCVPKFKNNPSQIYRGGAAYGEDTRDVLGELGFSSQEIEKFYESNIVK